MNMGNLTITLIEVQQLAYYTIRTFRVTKVSTATWSCDILSYDLNVFRGARYVRLNSSITLDGQTLECRSIRVL